MWSLCVMIGEILLKEKDSMRYYLAPLEGITTYIYRTAYHAYFAPMDKYFTPFLVPHSKKGFSTKEKMEIMPEHNKDMNVVPQIMSNNAEDFLQTVRKLEVYGYKEVNLNLGCPSKTVVSKYRGSGFLAKPDELNHFLDDIYNGTDVAISIKTRIGKEVPEEFEKLLEMYNQYPVKELIIHPRVQQDYYKNTPNLTVFTEALTHSKSPVCYNGDIFTEEDCKRFQNRFPEVETIMLGRGIVGNPALVNELTGKNTDRENLQKFHDKVLMDYLEVYGSEKNTLFKMKELWCYMSRLFPGEEKLLKKIKKVQKINEYKLYAEELFLRRS